MLKHNPPGPLIGSFAVLGLSLVGIAADGEWSHAAAGAAITVLIFLLFLGNTRTQVRLERVDEELQGVLGRETGRGEGPSPR